MLKKAKHCFKMILVILNLEDIYITGKEICTAEDNKNVRKHRGASMTSDANVQLMMHHTVELININFLTGGLYYCIQICVTKF